MAIAHDPELVDVALLLPEDKVKEINALASKLRLDPGDVVLLGAAALALYLSIRENHGRLKAEYPGGRETEINLT